MDLPSKQICLPQQLAYGHIAIIILTLLAVGIFECLNAKCIRRLMTMLEELERNQVHEKQSYRRSEEKLSIHPHGTQG